MPDLSAQSSSQRWCQAAVATKFCEQSLHCTLLCHSLFVIDGPQVIPVCDENVTVEQYLEAEMQRQVQKIKVRP